MGYIILIIYIICGFHAAYLVYRKVLVDASDVGLLVVAFALPFMVYIVEIFWWLNRKGVQ